MGILVAVSNDDNFETVLDVAVQLASGLEQDLHVTHITEQQQASRSERSFREAVQASLSEADVPAAVDLEHFDRSGLRSGTTVGKQLTERTEAVDIDHVVVGHRSKNRLATVRDGHTGFVVANEAAVPVTIVPDSVDTSAED